MHPVDVLARMPLGDKIRFDGLVYHGDKRDDVAQWYIGCRPDSVNLVLLQTRMPQSNFLLVVDPVLIVRPQARVQNPLLKAQPTLRQIIWNRQSLRRAAVLG